MDKIFVVEQICKLTAFPISSLAEEFVNRTGSGNIHEIELLNTLSSSFHFCACIENGKVATIFHLNDRLYSEDNINFYNPARLWIQFNSPNIEIAKTAAISEAASFLGRFKDVKLNATYNLNTGEMIPEKEHSGYETILIPMTESMKKHTLALLAHDVEAVTYWSLVTTLTFWASPSSEDHLYHFTFKEDGKHGDWHQDVTSRKITFWDGDKDYVIKVAEESSFKVVGEQGNENGSYEIIMKRVL